ncbi:MAG: Na+/H+ antiporter NhaA [Actinobacteria bacterium]|nr:MAG: Na+/H+ antiporter NhaA [Actinomycetota bacterium]
MSGRTAWTRNLAAPVRAFLQTETSSAVILLAATVAALVWANADASGYDSFWSTELSLRIGSRGVSDSLQLWVNDGLMVIFFLVVGLEARREFDLGELRERRRITLPLFAAIGGMVLPVAIYLAVNASGDRSGWGAAMSTDTAFALGALALVGPRGAQRLRVFLLSLVVADDLVALIVIALFYSENVKLRSLAIAVALFVALLLVRRARVGKPPLYLIGAAMWVALHKPAYPAARDELERATTIVRLFREQPTAELARSARASVESAVSPNERLQLALHPWTSFVIVPLFALANAGIPLNGDALSRAVHSPVTLGIVAAYVIGKPVGILGATWLITTLRPGQRRLPAGWAVLAGGAATAGIGFTVSLLVASLAFSGETLDEAKVGVLACAVLSTAVAWAVFNGLKLLSEQRRVRQLVGTAEDILDLVTAVDPERDHLRGPLDAPVALVEYGDFECPYCGRAEPIVRELLSDHDEDVLFVFRHLPLTDVHPHAQMAAEASEAAADQGRFWEMHDLLLANQDALEPADLVRYAEQLGLDVPRFRDEVRRRVHAGRVAEDVADADASQVTGTPTFFINGRRHHGAYDIASLEAAIRAARQRLQASRA